MNDQTDSQLLRAYAQHASEAAFAALVRRHVDFVYSAALRMVCDSHLAQDVTQGVFVALAKNASQLAERPVLSGWLHRTAQNIAAQTVRTEVRRRAREQEACAMNELLAPEPDALWEHIAPQLDAALGELSEPERDALLLRYFERKSAREIAQTLGISDEAAQKRVSRAVERLREFFAKHGVTVGASGLVLVISANAVQAAPVGMAVTISTAAALAGTSIVTPTAVTATIVAKTIAMTTLQKTFITAGLAAVLGTGMYEASQASTLRTQMQTLQQQQAPLAAQAQQLTRERDDSAARLAALQQENERLQRTVADVPRLRGEVARLQSLRQSMAQNGGTGTNDPFTQSVQALAAKAVELNQHLEQMPDKKIPELQFLNVNDWLEAAKDADFQSDADTRKALARLRNLAKHKFGGMAGNALDKYIQANNGQLPSDPSQLQPFFDSPVDDALLQRYQMLQTGNVNDLPSNTLVIGEKGPVDTDYDSHQYVGPHGRSSTWATGINESGDPDKTWGSKR